MGRKDPARTKAIKSELDEMDAEREAELKEADEVAKAMAEIAEETFRLDDEMDFKERVDRIYVENKRLGITPESWFCNQQWPSTEECRIRDELIRRWNADEQTRIELEYAAHQEAARLYPLLKSQGKTPSSWWNKQEATIYNRVVYEELCDLWEVREEPLTDQEIAEEKLAQEMA